MHLWLAAGQPGRQLGGCAAGCAVQSARLRPGRCEPFAQASPQANFCHRDRGHRPARPAARGAKAPQRGRPNPGMSTGSGGMPPRRLRRQPWPRWRAQRGRCTRGRSAWAWPATSPIADQILARPPAHGKRGRRLEADVGAPQRAQLPVVGPGNQGLVSSTRLQPLVGPRVRAIYQPAAGLGNLRMTHANTAK